METRQRKQNVRNRKAASANTSKRVLKSIQEDISEPLSKKTLHTELKQLLTGSAKPAVDGKKRVSGNHLKRDDLERLIQERTSELRTHQIELEMQNEELRSAQLELEASRVKYADLFEFAPIGYLTFDAKGVIQEANVTAANQLGISKRHLLNKPFSLFIHGPDGRLVFTAHRKETCLTQQRHTCELRLRRVDGAFFYAHLESIAVDNIDGKAGHIRTAVTDITERKKVDEALRESEERYRLLVDVSPDAIMIHDGKTCLFANKAAVRLLGATGPDRLVGCDIFSLLHPDFYEIVQDRVAAMKSEISNFPAGDKDAAL